jgi:hypothetical protein
MSDSTTAFVKRLAELSPALTALLQEHVTDNFGEILPHLFLGEVTCHVVALVQSPLSENSFALRRELNIVLESIESGYASGDADVEELIAASFLENLPTKGEPGAEIRGMIGPELGRQLKRMT